MADKQDLQNGSPIPILDFEKPVVELIKQIESLRTKSKPNDEKAQVEIAKLEKELVKQKKKIYGNLTPWQRVQLARHPQRPYSLDYIQMLMKDFVELHGDRLFSDDPAVVCGLASMEGQSLVVVGQQKGKDVKENLHRNYGMPHPEGYRKALRAFKLAEKFKLPVVCFVDTKGAFPGIGAEERGQAEAIARNLLEMSRLRVPVLVVIIGEGGSGGALAIGVGDRMLMMENSWYCVISPEGCAAILWGDRAKAPDISKNMKLTAKELKDLGIVDEVIPEPLGGANNDPEKAAQAVKRSILRHLGELKTVPIEKLVEQRIAKFSKMGKFLEG